LLHNVGLKDPQVKVLSVGETIGSPGRCHTHNVFGGLQKVLPLHDLW